MSLKLSNMAEITACCDMISSSSSVTSALDFGCLSLRPPTPPGTAADMAVAATVDCAPEIRRFADRRRGGGSGEEEEDY